MIKTMTTENEVNGYHTELESDNTCAAEILCLIDSLIRTIEKHTDLKYNEIIKEIKSVRKEAKIISNGSIDNTNK